MEVPFVARTKCEIHSVIRFLHAIGIPPVDIHRQLTEVYVRSTRLQVTLPYDNACPHVFRQTQDLWIHFVWTVMPHPPNSPNLAPSEYYLSPKFKKHLNGQRFRCDDEVKNEVKCFLNGLAAEFYEIGIQK
ncbi:unnamed protein product [Parnassius apollo]|uniref:(apollo) hypothetical protein n=1 Tax=Parnassius apollo TaxID=110799 RepID=A0A8S3XTU5_PARAO|nr:unnamed protein product [Parnassius apollo]